ncbi:hypothetical protein J2W96_007749 [Variovorax guangxiensis]|nr:hypothetical protein [Variovorax guangxiensis]MDR6861406.1 hypothetical protein [Variovorax guangxiensis]
MARVTFDIGADGRQAHRQPYRRIAQRIDEAACYRRIVPVQVVGPVRLDHQEGGVHALEESPELSCARVEASQEWLRTGLRQGVEGRSAPGEGPDLVARMQQLSREWGTDSSGGSDDGNLHGVSRG